MSELWDYVKERYFNSKGKNETANQMTKSRVKNTLVALCDEHLLEAGQIFTFEALPNELPFVISVIEEEPLKSKYNIYQVEETIFQASLKELEF